MGAGSARRIFSFLGSFIALVVVIAAIVLGQANGSAQPTTTAGRPTPSATAIAAASGVPTGRPLPTATVAPTVAVRRPTSAPTVPPRSPSAAPATNDGLATIPFGALPPEAQQTIALIDRGGPFPYDRDGITFGNREGLLPAQTNGYYREYTVITPGSADRGARRIIAGRDGQLYYTDDHYASFRRVVR